MANTYLYVVIILAIIFIGYNEIKRRFRKGYCIAHIYERTGESWVAHQKNYPCILRIAKDKAGQAIKWLNIPALKINWKTPKNEDMMSDLKGKRNIILAWYGGNNVRVIKPKHEPLKPILQPSGKYKIRKCRDPSLDVMDDDMKFLDMNLNDTIRNLWKKELTRWDKIAPMAAIALVGIFILAMVWVGSRNLAQASVDYNEASTRSEKLVGWIEEGFGRKVDDNTVVKTSPPKGGG